MKRVYSNGGKFDRVHSLFERLTARASRLHLAAPYFTASSPIVNAAAAGKKIQILVGLNSATHPDAIAIALQTPNVEVRFLTHRFHAKIYLFDDCAILGSANLTDGGFASNREAVICLDRPEDFQAVEEVRALFLELWEQARVLTPTIHEAFARAWHGSRPLSPDPDKMIEAAVGRAEPRKAVEGVIRSDRVRPNRTPSGGALSSPQVKKYAAAALADRLGVDLTSKKGSLFETIDGAVRAIVMTSRRYPRAYQTYWYGLYESQRDYLAGAPDAYLVLVGLDTGRSWAIPVGTLEPLLENMKMTHRSNGQSYWHINTKLVADACVLVAGDGLDLTPFEV